MGFSIISSRRERKEKGKPESILENDTLRSYKVPHQLIPWINQRIFIKKMACARVRRFECHIYDKISSLVLKCASTGCAMIEIEKVLETGGWHNLALKNDENPLETDTRKWTQRLTNSELLFLNFQWLEFLSKLLTLDTISLHKKARRKIFLTLCQSFSKF